MRPKQPEAANRMEDQQTTQTEVENQSQMETVETTETKQPEAQEESPFKKQLDELQKRADEAEAKLQEKDKIIENKNRAIEASKKKLKESGPEDELESRILARLEEKQNESSLDSKVKALTDDATEQELIKQHYKVSIVKTGNLENDLKNAVALANADRVWEQRRNRAMEERREDFLTSFSGTSLRGDAAASKVRDPIHAAAAELVRAVNPKAVDRLNEYFKK